MKKRAGAAVAPLAGLFLLMVLGACRPNQTVERQTDDAGIKTSIKAKLASDVRFSTLTAVSVDVTNGVVTLAGPVHSAEEKQKIEEVARAVKGVVNVTNNLQVEPSTSVTPAPATTSSATMPSAAAPSAAQPGFVDAAGARRDALACSSPHLNGMHAFGAGSRLSAGTVEAA